MGGDGEALASEKILRPLKQNKQVLEHVWLKYAGIKLLICFNLRKNL